MAKIARRKIDWKEVRQRVEQGRRALDRTLSDDPDRAAEIYRRRAEALARRDDTDDVGTRRLPMLVFRLRTERYAFALADLQEVLPVDQRTPVPGAPPELCGVINVRGEIRPVAWLARVLGLDAAENVEPTHVLLLRAGAREIGVVVDQIETMTALAQDAFTGSVPDMRGGPARFTKAITHDGVQLLDGQAVAAYLLSKERSI